MNRWIIVFAMLWTLGPSTSLGADASSPWAEQWFNPQPLPDDLILPMPCGASMVFRPVDVIASGPLDDHPMKLGRSDAPERAYKEGRRRGYLSGAFSVPGDAAIRRYYLAKYETTRDQFATLQDDACPEPSDAGRRPVTGLSWFDGVQFGRRYTEWLLENARQDLPEESPEPGFLRLPTEEEWEYAARGGTRVDDASFMAPVFPIAEDKRLHDYVWYHGEESAGANVRPVGELLPNPLGLFDILGNASELAFLPFHLDRHGRLHGQAGGYVIRGAYVLIPKDQVSSAWRQEHNFFDRYTGKAKTLEYTGARLAISAPVIVSLERIKQIRKSYADWKVLPSLAGDVSAAMAKLDAASAHSPGDVQAQLAILKTDLESAHAQMKSAHRRALDALVSTGAFIARRIVSDEKRAAVTTQLAEKFATQVDRDIQSLEEQFRDDPGMPDAREKLISELERKKEEWQIEKAFVLSARRNSVSLYSDTVIRVAQDSDPDGLSRALATVSSKLRQHDNSNLIPYARAFVRHCENFKAAPNPNPQQWVSDLLAIPQTDRGTNQ